MNGNTLALALCMATAGLGCSANPGESGEMDPEQAPTASSGATSGAGSESGEAEGGTHGGNDETGNATSDPTAGPPACSAVGFSNAELAWALPQVQGGPGFRNLGGVDDCGGVVAGFRYTTTDLTGDGSPDLILTYLCDTNDTGNSSWLVFESTGSGFPENPTSWSLPQIQGSPGFRDFSGVGDCAGVVNGFRYSTTDLTGDGLPDLVLTYLCDTNGTGDESWLVYENTGSGFSNNATTWSLPQIQGGPGFRNLSGVGDCGGVANGFRYSTADLTGDGLPDMVLTYLCDTNDTGDASWVVYENTGSGFSNSAITWSLPQIQGSPGFRDISGTGDCGGIVNGFRYSTSDLTGDALPDLVLTYLCDTNGTGDDSWLVYENNGSGFSNSATTWALPQIQGSPGFRNLGGVGDCGGVVNGFRYSVSDLTSDGLPDLVLTYLCDTNDTGDESWLVYENTGDGFSGGASTWSLPQIQGGPGFRDIGGVGDCGGVVNGFRYATTDLTSDGLPDLVLTYLCDTNGTGEESWLVYEGVCAP